ILQGRPLKNKHNLQNEPRCGGLAGRSKSGACMVKFVYFSSLDVTAQRLLVRRSRRDHIFGASKVTPYYRSELVRRWKLENFTTRQAGGTRFPRAQGEF